MRSSSVRARLRVVVAGGLSWLVAAMTFATAALAADPSPSPGTGGDPRSSGQGPGLVGEPVVAILIVVAIGVVAVGATLLYVRATGGPGRAP